MLTLYDLINALTQKDGAETNERRLSSSLSLSLSLGLSLRGCCALRAAGQKNQPQPGRLAGANCESSPHHFPTSTMELEPVSTSGTADRRPTADERAAAYKPGSIVRVRLKNFLTYADVEFKPGPR